MVSLFLFFLVANARAQIPETVVKISIYDLIPGDKKEMPPAYQLPADYGSQVARKISERRDSIEKCADLGPKKNWRKKWPVSLSISPIGQADPELSLGKADEKDVAACVREILREISYPEHKFRHAVTVEFPLEIQRKVL